MLEGFTLTVLCLLLSGPQRRVRLQLCAIAMATYFAASVLLPVLLEAITGSLAARTLWTRLNGVYGCSSRAVLWSNVARLVSERPLTGWGWGELDYAHFTTLYPGARFCEILDNAHNLPLHLAVELGLPVAALLCVGGVAWCWRQRPWGEQDANRQMAWAMLALVGVHSQLEYPLWYGPFQLAMGIALGCLLKECSLSNQTEPVHRLPAIALGIGLLAMTGYSTWDYWRVSQVYLSPQDRHMAWRNDPLKEARRSWIFSAQARFAELTLTDLNRDNAAWNAALAREMLHYSPEPRVVERLIEADTMLGNDREAATMLARFRAAFPGEYERWRQEQLLPASAVPRAQD
ncbi:MAG: hypothetical protein NVS2B4_03640 [Ramlibacter sp.]